MAHNNLNQAESCNFLQKHSGQNKILFIFRPGFVHTEKIKTDQKMIDSCKSLLQIVYTLTQYIIHLSLIQNFNNHTTLTTLEM